MRIPTFVRSLRISPTFTNLKVKPTNNQNIKRDLIGPPDPISNLRTFIFYESPNETLIEKKYRLKRMEVQKWNQEFWAKHNTNFIQEREKFVEQLKQNLNNKTSNADQMHIFYKAFLDKNWKIHLSYNIEWLITTITSDNVKLSKIHRSFTPTTVNRGSISLGCVASEHLEHGRTTRLVCTIRVKFCS